MNLAVLAGGRSSEHEVSLASAKAIRDGLAAAGHKVSVVEIDKRGAWRHDGKAVRLEPGQGLLGAEVVFPALHGPYGEDGTMQGLLEHLDVPYVGSGSLSSGVCMDKAVFKDRMQQVGLPQVEYSVLRHADDRPDEVAYPVFVKPSRLGSSVGISRVENAAQLEEALSEAFRHDSVVLLEQASPGREIECGVLGIDDLTVSVPGEIVVKDGWYDYEAKYTAGKAELTIPAKLDPAQTKRVQELAEQAFRATGCSGMARVDFFVEGDQVLINELNTIPGFTETSMYPKLFEATGVPFSELLDRLLEDARSDFDRYRQREH